MIFRIFNRKYYGYFLNSTSLYKIRHIAVWVFNRRRTLLCNKYGISLGTNSQPNWLICAWVLGLESIESVHLTADQMRKDLQPQVENIISSRRVYWLGQPCKAGWQPPALGRWYCQAPTGWLELRPVRRPHPSHYSLHYFTTPLERPSPLVARRRHRPPLCSNVCTQTMSLQQILFYQLLVQCFKYPSLLPQFNFYGSHLFCCNSIWYFESNGWRISTGDYHTQYFHDLYALKSIVLLQWCWKSTLCWVPSVDMNTLLQYIRTRGKIRHWYIGLRQRIWTLKRRRSVILQQQRGKEDLAGGGG